MRCTVGDTIKIVANHMEHGFAIGDECIVMNRELDASCFVARKIDTEIQYNICDEDVELVSEVVRES